MSSRSLILVVNPGSSSRKYGLYNDDKKLATINFEFEDNKVIGKIEYNSQKHSIECSDLDLSGVSGHILPLLHKHEVIRPDEELFAIGIRVVAPVMRFTQDELLTDEVEEVLESIQQKAPLHITTVLAEIKQIKSHFPSTPLVAVSDTAFHSTKPTHAWYYGIDTKFADESGVKRYGYHGISVGSIVHYLTKNSQLAPKTVVCHLGSGSSITSVQDGKSIETTMGYSPLEGLLMASRSGNIDVSAALAIKRELGLTDDGLEQYLNKQSGLLGVSGSSNDVRQLLASEESGDKRAKLALDLLVYRIQQSIGQMAACMDGVDTIVFTGTIGERSAIIRERVLERLSYLGFTCDKAINNATFEPSNANIATSESKPVLVVSTDEAAEIARRAARYMQK